VFPAYSKNCHIKNFGTKDLRHANLPNRDQAVGLSPPTSPRRDTRGLNSLPTSPSRPTPASVGSTIAGRSFAVPLPKPPLVTKLKVTEEPELCTGGGRIGMNDLPGPPPPSPTKHRGDDGTMYEDESADSVDALQRAQAGGATGAVTSGWRDAVTPPMQTSTGTRYGRGLTGVGGGTNRQWGGGTPVCPKCGKLVYFAEQVSGQYREISNHMLTHLRRREQSVKRFTKYVCGALNVTLGWTLESCPKGMHGLIVTDVMQRCDASFYNHVG